MTEVATEIAKLREKEGFNVWGLDFSPDGKYLAASSPSSPEVHIWDWRNSRIVRTLEQIKQGSSTLSSTEPIRFSPDGRLLATCHRRAQGNVVIRLWDVMSGEVVRDITDQGFCVAVAFTPDGKSFVWISDRPIHLPGDHLIVHSTTGWEPAWGVRTAPFYPHALAVSPDGTSIAVGGTVRGPNVASEHQILIVDTAKRAVIRTIVAFPTSEKYAMESTIERLAWHPDGIHLAASARVTGRYGPNETRPDAVRIFNARSGELVAREQPPEYARIWALRYTPNGKYLIEGGFSGRTIRTRDKPRDLLRPDGGSSLPSAVRIWDGEHRRLKDEIAGEPASAAVTSDGRYLALGGDGAIFIFELK